MKKFFALVIMMISVLISPLVVNAEFTDYKHWSTMKTGDEIYFDTTNYGWDNVYIYIWNSNTSEQYTSWDNAPEMQSVEGKDNLLKFTVTEDMNDKYNMIIFKNGVYGNDNQTIDVGFIESRFVYKLRENDIANNGTHKGYWYLYDNSDIVEHINNVKAYQNDKEYYTSDTYLNLDELIQKAVTESENEMVLYSRQENDHDTDDYYMQIELTLNQIDEIINNLLVDKSKLQNLVDEIENDKDNIENTNTPSTVQNLLNEIENQKQVLSGNNVTVDDIKDGINALNDAKDALVRKADKSELTELLNSINQLNEDDYTTESFNELKNAKNGAQDILDNQEITQDEVDNYVANLRRKVDSLVRKTDNGNTEVNDNTTQNSNSTTNNNVDSPKTLDNIVKIVVIFVVSALALVGLIVLKKKTSKK